MRFVGRLTLVISVVLLIGSTIGCQGRATIPAEAVLAQAGQGRPISFTADRAGNAYVLDATSNQKVYETLVHEGDQLVVEPMRDRIVLGQEEQDHKIELQPDHTYQVYFDAGH